MNERFKLKVNPLLEFKDQMKRHHSDSKHKYYEVYIKTMLEFLIDNIF